MKLFPLLILFTTSLLSAPGDYNTEFGTNGLTIKNYHEGNDKREISWAITKDSEGNYYQTGGLELGTTGRYMYLSKVSSDGIQDDSFGFGGQAIVSDSTARNEASALAIQTDGKIVSVGYSKNETGNGAKWLISRFLPTGALDYSFSGDGKASLSFSSDEDLFQSARSVSIAADDKIYIGGKGNNEKLTLLRLLPNGFIDNTFNFVGRIELDLYLGNITNIHNLDSGKILLTGAASLSSETRNLDMFAARLNSNGSLDQSFGDDGIKLITFDFIENGEDISFKSVIDSAGTIYLAGATQILEGDYDFAAASLDVNGNFNTGFGIEGKSIFTVSSSSYDYALGLALQNDSKLILCGYSGDTPVDIDYTFIRINKSDASLDSTFGSFGYSILDIANTTPNSHQGGVTDCLVDNDQLIFTSLIVNNSNDDEMVGVGSLQLESDLIFSNNFD